jgi:hypothetical protein
VIDRACRVWDGPVNLDPEEDCSMERSREERKKAQLEAKKIVCKEGECKNCVNGELSHFNSTFKRFRMPENHRKCVGCQLGSGALEVGLHVLLYCAPFKVAQLILEEYLVFCDYMDGCCV